MPKTRRINAAGDSVTTFAPTSEPVAESSAPIEEPEPEAVEPPKAATKKGKK